LNQGGAGVHASRLAALAETKKKTSVLDKTDRRQPVLKKERIEGKTQGPGEKKRGEERGSAKKKKTNRKKQPP